MSLVADDRVLVNGQTDASENGIYIVATGAWTRAPDMSGNDEVATGTMVYVTGGSLAGLYRVTTSGTIELGTDDLAFDYIEFSSLAALAVIGALTVGGAAAIAGILTIANGAVGAPGIAFASDPDTGLYRVGANNLGIAAGGVKILDLTAALVTLPLGQLAFPATQNPSSNANTLDDYEEGSTTPTPTPATGAFTTVSAALRYTKIGRRVFCSCKITVTSLGTAAGAFSVPLPFTSAAYEGHGGGMITGSGTALSVYITSGGANVNVLKAAGTTPGETCEFTFSYDI